MSALHAAQAHKRLREQKTYAGRDAMPPAAVALQTYIKVLCEADRLDFARRAGVYPISATRMGYGNPINASDFLAMCAASGIDPVTGDRRPIANERKQLAWQLLAAGCAMKRMLMGFDLRGAAEEVGVSYSTIYRCERGEKIAIESVLAICAFIGVHPDHYLIACSTGNT